MSKELTVGIGDEMWQAFKNVYEHKNKTKLEHDQEAEYEARDLMAEAIKAYVLTDDVKETPTMIPIHDWIWDNFKKAYSARNKDNPRAKDALEVVHDWACRAMQYYTMEGLEDPWTIMEAYEIALSCPDIHIKRERGIWDIETAHMFNVEAKNANDLLRKVRASKDYIEASVPQHRTVRDIIREAYAITEICPAILIEELRDGWFIYLKDEEYPGDYSVKAKDAEQLLREVKIAKECYEAAMENREKHGKAVKLDEDEEERAQEWKDIREEAPVIRLGGLPTTTILLLLHLVESLSFKAVTDILGEQGIADTWDELYIIRQKLKDSLADPRRKR